MGVVTSQYRVGQNLNFAVSVATLRRLLAPIGAGARAAPLGTAGSAGQGSYLRNVAFSAAFFALLFVAFRRLK